MDNTPKTVSVTLELPERVATLLAVLAGGEFGPDDLQSVVLKLIDHAQQGVYRPGAWERGWLEQAFGDEWQDRLEPDTDDTAADGRVIFQRPIKPCPNTPQCAHPLSAHVTDAGEPPYCLDCDCGDSWQEAETSDA